MSSIVGSSSVHDKPSIFGWWKQLTTKQAPRKTHRRTEGNGIFGISLQDSVKKASVAIWMTDANGHRFVYGYIPVVVAKCGAMLKERATEIEGIFRLSGSAKRINDLQVIFDLPPNFGKHLAWDGYTVHDAANILRRYIRDLPEPIIPFDFYNDFREPLKSNTSFEFSPADLNTQYQSLINRLPDLNRYLLLYLLDLLSVFANKSKFNLMTASNLAAIFQPGILSHSSHTLLPEEYKLSQDVLIYLIENQDHFLMNQSGPNDEHPPSESQSNRPINSMTSTNISAESASQTLIGDQLQLSVSNSQPRKPNGIGLDSPVLEHQ